MKKLIALACMITCIFGLTACGSEEEYTLYEQQKISYASQMASQQIIPMILDYATGDMNAQIADFTVDEIQYVIGNSYNLNIESGFVLRSAVESFNSTLEDIGSIVSLGEVTAEIDDDTIVVHVQVDGELKDAEAEVIVSNDMFFSLQSAALNAHETMGDLMVKAALNTLIGMGTVFTVLLLICGIIYCFAFIPKIQAKFSKKKDDNKTSGIDNAVAQITTQEESVDESDDKELVAVIAAAVAAYEGEASTDGFVVRSIRKVNMSRR